MAHYKYRTVLDGVDTWKDHCMEMGSALERCSRRRRWRRWATQHRVCRRVVSGGKLARGLQLAWEKSESWLGSLRLAS